MEDIQNLVESRFKLFDPKTLEKDILPRDPGNYIFVLRKYSQLPEIGITPIFHTLNHDGIKYKVVYTGKGESGLRKRIYTQHFTGNDASRSTLRKSLGSLRGFKKVPRVNNSSDNGKTKFSDLDEEKLSLWMKENLLVFYYANKECEKLELALIDFYNPPLNLDDNYNLENFDYRDRLSELRNKKG